MVVVTEIKNRFLSAMRYIIADENKFGIKRRFEFANAIGWKPAALARCERTEDHYVKKDYSVHRLIEYVEL